jgi:Tfp pilus assembly protein PilV
VSTTPQHPRAERPARADGEAGFTLIEALIAMIVLVFGLIAVGNLLVVATSSNRVAGTATAAANVAQQQIETLRNTPYLTLVAQVGATQTAVQSVAGMGNVNVSWDVQQIEPELLFIRLRAESDSPLARARSRAEYTMFRACTNIGCP